MLGHFICPIYGRNRPRDHFSWPPLVTSQGFPASCPISRCVFFVCVPSPKVLSSLLCDMKGSQPEPTHFRSHVFITCSKPRSPAEIARTRLLSTPKVYKEDAISLTWRPPPNTDGTPNESVNDVFVRVRQVTSVPLLVGVGVGVAAAAAAASQPFSLHPPFFSPQSLPLALFPSCVHPCSAACHPPRHGIRTKTHEPVRWVGLVLFCFVLFGWFGS